MVQKLEDYILLCFPQYLAILWETCVRTTQGATKTAVRYLTAAFWGASAKTQSSVCTLGNSLVPSRLKAQDPICFCWGSRALLTYVHLVVHQDPQIPSSKGAPQPHSSWPGDNFLVMSSLSFIQFLLVHSSGLSRSLCKMALSWHVHLIPQFGVISKLGEGDSDAVVLRLFMMLNSDWPVSVPGGPHSWQAAGLSQNNVSPLCECGLAGSLLPHNLPSDLYLDSLSRRSCVQCFAEIQVNNVNLPHCRSRSG